MDAPEISVAAAVRHHVENASTRAFLTTGEIPGPRRAVETALSRLAFRGELLRVRHGLYWKAPKTQVGAPRPRPNDIALKVAGPGSGPAGASAARALGLTTQVPSVEEIAIPGRVPKPIPGVVFTSRPLTRRLVGLRPLEVAVVETLRTWPMYSESSWEDFAAAISRAIGRGAVRPKQLVAALHGERSPQARALWAKLGLSSASEPS
jgi:hypothetical protein